MDDVSPLAVKTYNQKIDRFLNKDSKNWNMIIKSYKEIIYMVNIVKDLNTLKREIWLNYSYFRDYEFELKEIKTDDAEFYYQKATKLMDKNNQDSFKKFKNMFPILKILMICIIIADKKQLSVLL